MTRFLTSLFVFLLFVLTTDPAQAQFRVGVAYGSDAEIGVAAGYQLPFAVDAVEGLSFGVDGIFYIPRTEGPSGAEVETTAFEVNGNAHYPLTGNVYGLAGLQYAYVSADVTAFGVSVSASDSQLGLNAGAGISMGRLFGEAKYTVGGFEQLALTVGFSF